MSASLADSANAPRRRPAVVPSVLVRSPRAVLWTVAVLSVLVHLGLALAVYDEPLGRIDPELLRSPRRPLRIKRAVHDPIAPALRLPGVGVEPPQQAAQRISQSLLEQMTPPPPPELEMDLGRTLREASEPEPPAAQQAAAEQPPAIDLPVFPLPAQALALQPQHDADAAASGSAAGVQLGITQQAQQARQLLAQAGPAGAGGSTGSGGALPGGAIDLAPSRERPPMDQRLFQAPLEPLPIDFAQLALEGTTQLKVPEHLDNDFDYYLSRYEPDDRDRSQDPWRGYWRVDIAARSSLKKLRTMAKDTVFLIDTSGSVPQEWVTQIIAGVRQSLGSLNEGDRFNLVLFNERPAFLSVDGPLPATQANIDQAHRFLAGARSQGWTDVNAALSRLLVRDVAAQRVYNLILISDGKPTRGVLSTRDLINLITRDNNLAASIYCVGVGPQQNRELLEFLAYRNQGLCVFVDRVDHVAAALRDLASRLRYPLIKNLHVSVAGQEVGQVYPVHLPNVHQGQRLSIYGRYTTLAEFTVHITGDSADGPVDFTFTRDLNAALPEGRELARAWALWKLHHLYSQILHHEGPDPSIQRQIDDLRRRYGLKTLY